MYILFLATALIEKSISRFEKAIPCLRAISLGKNLARVEGRACSITRLVRLDSPRLIGRRGGGVGNLATSERFALVQERKPPPTFTWANLRVECG